jgi:hypothetical protein
LVVVLSAAPLPADVLSTVHVCPCHQCAIVDYFVASRRPLLPTIASRCLVALLPSIDRICHSRRWWWLRLPPAQQHTDHINKLKMFPVSTLMDLF